MSCEEKRHTTWFLSLGTIYFCTFQVCWASARWEEAVHRVHDKRTGSTELPPGSPTELLLFLSNVSGEEAGVSWTAGEVQHPQRSWSSHPEAEGYQGDSAGFHGVQGKVLGPTFDPSPHSQWLRPLVQCDHHAMTFTVSGEGLTQLLVEREEASPISPFHLPPYCGYSVRMSWSDLEMMVPYDACYITQENGSYVLPMLWWGSQLKLSCPMQMPPPALSPSHYAPSVLCSSYGMAVQVYAQERDIPLLGVTVNGLWAPFVSAECAYRVYSQPEDFIFFIFFSNPCVTAGDDLRLQLVFDEQRYLLSCPVYHWAPSSPPPTPSDPQVPYAPDPVTAAPTHPPQPPTQEYSVQFPDYPHYRYPQVYPPGPQLSQPPQPLPDSAPRPQQFFHPSSPPPHHSSNLYYPYVPFYYPPVTPAPAPTSIKTTSPPELPGRPQYPWYYVDVPHSPVAPTPPPVSPIPSPPPPPVAPQHPVDVVYPTSSYHPHYPDQRFFYPTPDAHAPPSPTASSSTATPKRPDSSRHPHRHPYPQEPVYFLPPVPSPETSHPSQRHQQPSAPQAVCPPDTQTVCSYHPYHYYPYYPHLYGPVTRYPTTDPPVTAKPTTTPRTSTTTTSTTSPPTRPTPQTPRLQCLTGKMVVFLPSAHPGSIQVRDQRTWLFISSVSPLCGYAVQVADSSGVFLQSPLPACHSQSRTPTAVSLPLRFWDLSIQRYRTLDLQCPYRSPPPTLVTPSVAPTVTTTSPSTTTTTTKSPVSTQVIPKPKVICSPRQMVVELPPGPISGLSVKDVSGNPMSLQDSPKRCRYSASAEKNGNIQLSLQLQSGCHMHVQGKMYIITVVYVTGGGTKEAQFSCPVSTAASGQECSIPREQRLPCRRGSVSQSQCLSVGCCFSSHPPTCYYPMDECTADRHFVFSVPASLTEPPLSPALLVVASNSTCRPERVTPEYALFKVPMDGCGARRLEVGKTVIYMVEVINVVHAISLNYGTITRDSPVRVLVECRYIPGSVLTVSYLVKTPSVGPAVQTQGVFGVQLRISKDAQYSSYYPQYHQPLQMLLGKPLYLEVRLLNPADPSLVLLVHFCVAYPRSGKAVWVLLYNGCPNPLDPAPQQDVVSAPLAQTRRFTISTFQFLPDGEFKDPDEEIYFMCSTEICSPRDGPCVEGCFGQ